MISFEGSHMGSGLNPCNFLFIDCESLIQEWGVSLVAAGKRYSILMYSIHSMALTSFIFTEATELVQLTKLSTLNHFLRTSQMPREMWKQWSIIVASGFQPSLSGLMSVFKRHTGFPFIPQSQMTQMLKCIKIWLHLWLMHLLAMKHDHSSKGKILQ